MEVIGFGAGNTILISAKTSEVKEILSASVGKTPSEIEIGQKIPAIDYASTIRKVKSLKSNYEFTSLKEKFKSFDSTFKELIDAVESAANIEV